MKNNDKNVKLSESFLLNLRRKWLVDGAKTFLIMAILVALYIALNIWLTKLDLPKIDVTENKIYTLSDASKKALDNINQEIKIYAYGFTEKDSLIRLLEQYNKSNPQISYEILTEENNYEMIKENDLKDGYHILIIKSGDRKKVIDASSDFYTYDYSTYQQVDTTEQTITNSILSLNVENKPKVYFMQGHGELTLNDISVIPMYLENENFEVSELNLVSTGEVPNDCNVLAIVSPNTDFYESETQAIKNYINKGGNIFFTMDIVEEGTNLPNLQSILNEYGVSVENGYILENSEKYHLSGAPNIFNPQLSSSNKITADIYSDSRMWLVYSARLKFLSNDELTALNVTKEDLLTTTDEASFVTNLSENLNTANSEKGVSTIASIITKKLGETMSDQQLGMEILSGNQNAIANMNDKSKESKLVICATGMFISNYTVKQLTSDVPISYLEGNKDFAINSFAELADKDYTLTIRKDITNSTYAPTTTENIVVLCIIFITPVVIILTGIIIGRYRKKRK